MSHRPLHALADHEVLPRLAELVARDRATTAEMLALLGRAGARRLAAGTPYPSLFRYCVGALGMSGDMAWKRIQAARAARRFSAILAMVADGRLHLTTVVRLAPHLTRENAGELLAAAAGRSRREVELLLAARFPRPEMGGQAGAFALGTAVGAEAPLAETATGFATSPTPCELVPEPVAPASDCAGPACETALVPEPVRAPRGRVTPVGPGRFSVEFECGAGAEAKLRRAQALLAHAAPGGALPEVFERALDALIERLEKRRYAATDRPRSRPARASTNPRHIPAEVKRAVRERDGDRCTFASADGQRCEERGLLEYDHVVPVACGGESTAANLRLRCRTHNQHAADRAFGVGFMERKREEAKQRAAAKLSAARARDAAREAAAKAREAERARKEAHARELAANAEARARAEEVIPWLRTLGVSLAEARKAAATCEALAGAPLEQRVRHALRHLAPPGARTFAPVTAAPA